VLKLTLLATDIVEAILNGRPRDMTLASLMRGFGWGGSENGEGQTGVCTKNLDSDVVVMKSAKDRV
jgi:hypothetical protein